MFVIKITKENQTYLYKSKFGITEDTIKMLYWDNCAFLKNILTWNEAYNDNNNTKVIDFVHKHYPWITIEQLPQYVDGRIKEIKGMSWFTWLHINKLI